MSVNVKLQGDFSAPSLEKQASRQKVYALHEGYFVGDNLIVKSSFKILWLSDWSSFLKRYKLDVECRLELFFEKSVSAAQMTNDDKEWRRVENFIILLFAVT